MKTEQFNYNLPESLIAKYPPKERGGTRLLVVKKDTGEITHRRYTDIPEYIQQGDVVVLNQTKVINARIYANVKRTGRRVECLFLKPLPSNFSLASRWYSLVGRAKHVKIGDVLVVENSDIHIIVIDRREGMRGFDLEIQKGRDNELFNTYGHVPLPPYMGREDDATDEIRYNTVFAKDEGSVAAPTASLNLTEDILKRITSNGAKIAHVTLDVGWGTFAPVDTDKIEDFKIHRESYEVDRSAADVINNSKRVITFGTTATRTIESATTKETGRYIVTPQKNETELFIYPGYNWKVVDCMVTNFHAPGSSLIMLVAGMIGYDLTMHIYNEAIKEKYNFLSYGDSMLII